MIDDLTLKRARGKVLEAIQAMAQANRLLDIRANLDAARALREAAEKLIQAAERLEMRRPA